MNFLEQLVAEWYEYSGYFVRSNVKFGKRKKGGYTGEMDVVAFDPASGVFLHIETSSDADSGARRKKRFEKKFADASNYYDTLFPFQKKEVRRIAVVGFEKKSNLQCHEGIKYKTIRELTGEICAELKKKKLMTAAVPERYPLLRAIQFAVGLT